MGQFQRHISCLLLKNNALLGSKLTFARSFVSRQPLHITNVQSALSYDAVRDKKMQSSFFVGDDHPACTDARWQH